MVVVITTRCKERGNGPNHAWAVKCLNWQVWRGKKEGGKTGHGGIRAAAAAGRRGRGKKKRKGEGETDEWGPGVSECKEKKTREGEAGRRGEG
jgi:hypothetical protein